MPQTMFFSTNTFSSWSCECDIGFLCFHFFFNSLHFNGHLPEYVIRFCTQEVRQSNNGNSGLNVSPLQCEIQLEYVPAIYQLNLFSMPKKIHWWRVVWGPITPIKHVFRSFFEDNSQAIVQVNVQGEQERSGWLLESCCENISMSLYP